MAVDPASQDVYVADESGQVDVFNSAGVFQFKISGPAGEEFHPRSVAVSDKTGDVYVTSQTNLYVFNGLGAYLAKITGTPEGFFSFLSGVAVDQSSGDVYVVDAGQKALDRFNFDNTYQPPQLPLVAQPEGVTVDASGNVFVSETESESEPAALNEFNPKGEQVLHITGTPSGSFRQLGEVALDSDGNIYVTAQFGHESVAEFDSSGALVDETRTFVTSSRAPNSFLGGPAGVAVNAAGTMYVSDALQRIVDVFGPSVLVPGVSGEPATGVSDSAANLHGMVNPEGTEVGSCEFEYRTAGEPEYGHHSIGCSPSTPYTGTTNVAVEATPSNLEANTTYYYRLVASNAKGVEGGVGYGPEESFKTPGRPLVEDVSAEVNPTEKVGQTNATLHASIDPDGRETTYAFEYGETESYGTSIPIPAEAIGSGEAFVPVTAELHDLKIGTTYHYRVSATNEFGTVFSSDQTFSTLPAVLIESESASDVKATSATLEALIDPLGAGSTCEFQYVTDASFRSSGYAAAVSVPCPAALGEGEVGVPTSVHLQSFSADTIYHYRAVATNELGTVEGADRVFRTQRVAATPPLPDGRRWELVSPPDKRGALLEGLANDSALQASADGGAMGYYAIGATESQPQGQAEGAQVLSVRSQAGWSSQDIATPHVGAVGSPTLGRGAGEYYLFSEDLSRALVEPHDRFKPFSPPMACTATGCVPESFPEATEFTAYMRHNSTCASDVSRCYEPLLTGAPGYADVPLGTEFGEPFSDGLHEEFVGAAPDLNSVVLASEKGLTPGAPDRKELYEWSAGAPATERLQLVSVLPPSEGGGPAGAGGVELGGYDEPTASGWRPVSADGSRVFWTVGGPFSAHRLYMRDTVKGETILISAASPAFQAASSDGSKVFFTTNTGDLNVCEIVEEAGKDACKLTDLTLKKDEESAQVQQLMPGTSDDGSYGYFVAKGVLTVDENGQKERAVPDGENLYMVHHAGAEWVTTFIASLSQTDEYDWANTGEAVLTFGALTARVSPDGRYLAFMSNRSLTGYDNNDAITGNPDEEVYLYDAQTGRLACASCNPTGARPVGVEVGQVANGGAGNGNLVDILAGLGGAYGDHTGIAANLPGGVQIETKRRSLYQPRYLSDSGRLFFNSSDALVPRDINRQEDVYEYEPLGIKSSEGKELCAESSQTFSARSDGCVDLISSGTSSAESGFMDASETGGDVFFLTKSKLLPEDFDTALDVYDAHECTSQVPCIPEPPVSPPACTNAESCRAAPSPQPSIFGSPASATFSGAGNVSSAAKPVPKSTTTDQARVQKLRRALAACRKRPRRAQRSCRAKARSRYSVGSQTKNAKKSSRGAN